MPPLNSASRTVLAAAIAQTLLVPSASAITLQVSTTVDETTETETQSCTLREAVTAIVSQQNQSGCGDISGSPFGVNDTIVFFSNINGDTITLTQDSAININNNTAPVNLTIQGNGQDQTIIDANDNSGVFSINNATVIIDGVTISGASGGSGGGMNNTSGGAIYSSSSTVTVSNSTISNNSRALVGGGIFAGSSSEITLQNCVLSNNSSDFQGGALTISSSNVSISDCTLTDNGGSISAIFLDNSSPPASVSIRNSMISGSRSALTLFDAASATVVNSIFKDNDDNGIGIGGNINLFVDSSELSGNQSGINIDQLGGPSAGSVVSVSNSTISGNGTGQGVGGIFLGADLTLLNSTITDNIGYFAGGLHVGQGDVLLSNNIIAGNRGGSSREEMSFFTPFNVTSRNNLIGDNVHTTEQATEDFTPSASDIIATSNGTDPTLLANILGPLANNGCELMAGAPGMKQCVKTHALIADSPALDAARESDCPATDQREEARDTTFFVVTKAASDKTVAFDLGGNCDIGALESDL